MGATAILSDIHANQEALDAVLEDARTEGAERYWCLGDIVGYGARPRECTAILRELCAVVIKGNHEQAVLTGPFGFNPAASAAILWTRQQLSGAADGMGFMATLAERVDMPDATLVHGSPTHPLDEYLFREDTIEHLPRSVDFSPKLHRSFQLIDRPCFVGHTHVPGVIEHDMVWVDPADCDFRYKTARRPCIVNVGSVGQPRDGDRRASYALFDGEAVTFRRVAYDVEAAAGRIFAEPGLPDILGQRLLEGW